MTAPETAKAEKYAKKKRQPNPRELRRIAEKARKTKQHRRNARHG